MSNVLFFFSSRRRHTMWTGDWSSDVCSSDLAGVFLARPAVERRLVQRAKQGDEMAAGRLAPDAEMVGVELTVLGRSEERRVGKETRPGKSPNDLESNPSTTESDA